MRASVLIIDDDKLTRWSLTTVLARLGYEVREAATGDAGLAALSERRPDLILLDIVLPDTDGLRVLADIRAHHPSLPVLLMTANPSRESRRLAEQLGASAYLEKPLAADALESAIATHLARG
jgi:two-component system nitrogen regulation response regulator GlnG